MVRQAAVADLVDVKTLPTSQRDAPVVAGQDVADAIDTACES